MTGPVAQSRLREELLRASRAVSARVAGLQDELTAIQLGWAPPEGGWGVGQVLEHLCVAHDSYLARLRAMVPPRGAGAPASGDTTWRPTLVGRLLVHSLRSPRRLPAPRMYRVASTARAGVAGEFLARQRELEELMERAAPLDWRRERLSSPISGLVRLNLGDAFLLQVVHAERHRGQIDRVLGHPAFPARS